MTALDPIMLSVEDESNCLAGIILISMVQGQGCMDGTWKARSIEECKTLWSATGCLGDRHSWVTTAMALMRVTGLDDEDDLLKVKSLLYGQADILEAEMHE